MLKSPDVKPGESILRMFPLRAIKVPTLTSQMPPHTLVVFQRV